MDFRGLVCKRLRRMTLFCLKYGQGLENQAAHPHQEFLGVPPRGLVQGRQQHFAYNTF